MKNLKISEIIVLAICLGIFIWVLLVSINLSRAADTVIWQTYPGYNVIDYRKPALIIKEDGSAFQTYPGTDIPDLTKPGFQYERYDGTGTYQHRVDEQVQQSLPYVWPQED